MIYTPAALTSFCIEFVVSLLDGHHEVRMDVQFVHERERSCAQAVKDDYYFQMYYDDLPLWVNLLPPTS